MIIRNKDRVNNVKKSLLTQLRKERVFWSYAPESIDLDSISDDQLIARTMRYLYLLEIQRLFSICSFSKIKAAWRRLMVPEGEYLYTLNRLLAWYYFKAKNLDAYLKSLEPRHLNSLLNL